MTTAHRTITGRVVLSRVHLLRFPAYAVTGDEGVLAEIGRFGWFRIFFGPGQRIRLADGARWRLKSIGRTRYISPLIVNDEGLRVAEAAPGIKKAYGINGPDYAFTLYPATAGWGRAREWVLRDREQDAGLLRRNPMSFEARVPVPLPALLLAFTVANLGIPGEAFLHAPRSWGSSS